MRRGMILPSDRCGMKLTCAVVRNKDCFRWRQHFDRHLLLLRELLLIRSLNDYAAHAERVTHSSVHPHSFRGRNFPGKDAPVPRDFYRRRFRGIKRTVGKRRTRDVLRPMMSRRSDKTGGRREATGNSANHPSSRYESSFERSRRERPSRGNAARALLARYNNEMLRGICR